MGKKGWIKPEAKKVKLLPEECLITACKTSAAAIGRSAGNKFCGVDKQCATTLGS
jgi:hypothetical protein